METDLPQEMGNRKRSPKIRNAKFIILGLLILMAWISGVWIWWLVRPDPLPEGGDYTPAFTQVFKLVEEAAPDKNYFTRKLALARLHLKIDQLSDYPQSKPFVDPIKREYGDQLFSREEWLGF